jgi:two-component system response regulator YesN
MAMGAARYILKPIRLAEVEETLRDLAQKLEKERRIREKEDAWKLQPDTENGSGESLNFMNYDKRPLLQAVESGEQELICEECTKLEQALNDQRVVSHMHLILIVTSIFEELVRLMQKADQVIPQLEGDPMEYYSRIVSDDGTRAEILKNLQEFCCVVGDLFAKAHETRQQASLKRAIRYMEQEYRNEELLMGDVAKHSFVSSSYLSTMLKKETGKTFSEYLTDIRMEHAKKLLRETEMKSYEVAQACGFANATYFSTVFKRMNGMSPSAWKKARE